MDLGQLPKLKPLDRGRDARGHEPEDLPRPAHAACAVRWPEENAVATANAEVS